LEVAQAGQISPVFRNTLKKLQGRWSGELPGISGAAEYLTDSTDLSHIVSGNLTNNSGYDLRDVDLLVYLAPASAQADSWATRDGAIFLFHMTPSGRVWKTGETMDLAVDPKLDTLEMQAGDLRPGTMELALRVCVWKLVGFRNYNRYYGSGLLPMVLTDQQKALERRTNWREDLLFFLADARNLDPLDAGNCTELVRGVGRMTDCTKALRAAGGMILAHADDVKTPVPLRVNGKAVEGKGSVSFAWVLPVAGKAPQAGYGGPGAARGSIVPEQETP
jgi:hypothetical protein